MTDLDDALKPWVQIATQPAADSRALFLDRDGTIIENVPYLSDADAVSPIPGATDTINAFHSAGFAVVIVTNQSGVARGLISPEQYNAVDAATREQLGRGFVNATYACPYHPEGEGQYGGDHDWRKPNGGMITAAAEHLRLDLTRSVMVGDSLTDIMAAANAGVGVAIHVLTGHGASERDAVEQWVADQKAGGAMPHVRFVSSIAAISPEDLA